MYYYIFDLKKCPKKTQIEAIKDYLVELGISGEFTFITSAQTAEDLALRGINKKYSTIIAAGSDDLINSVANVMIGREEAMGIIPLQASETITNLIGTSSWKVAAQTLRFRKIKDVSMGKTADGKHFFTYISLKIRQSTDVTLEFKDFFLQAKISDLVVSNFHPNIPKRNNHYLDVVIHSYQDQALFNKIKSFFLKDVSDNISGDNGIFLSHLRVKSLRIFTKSPTPLLCNERVISKTPQLIEISDQTLRLIVTKSSQSN